MAALDDAPGSHVYEIGGPEATTYRDMIATYAAVRCLRPRRIIDVPVLTPRLSAWWVDLVTPVDRRVSHALIESLTTDVVVEDLAPAAMAFDVTPLGVAAAIDAALEGQAACVSATLTTRRPGLQDGVYAMRSYAEVAPEDAAGAKADLGNCGGDLRWYGLPLAWRLRMVVGRLFGERLPLSRPAAVEQGAQVDWWRVAVRTDDTLVLTTSEWFSGEAWLGYEVGGSGDRQRVEQVAALRPKGLLGLAYWRALYPIHLVVFRVMSRRQAQRSAKPRRPAGTCP